MIPFDFESIPVDENSDPDLKMLNQSKVRLKKIIFISSVQN